MILVDTAEPEDIIRLLKQSVDVTVLPLNQTLRADYYFGCEDGTTQQFCRVQAGELLSNIDSEEDELHRYYSNADHTDQIVEGVISDTPITKKDKSMESISVRMSSRPSTLFAYRIAPSGYLFGEHAYNVSADKLYAWIYRLSKCGVTTFSTHNFVGTAKFIASAYHNSQKLTHDTMNRYYIPRISLGERDDENKRISIREQNPFIRALMALSIIYHLDIGEMKATALYKAGYKTISDLAFASVKELTKVEGFGKLTAEKLLNAIGGVEL
jgi:DNA integrity scanning protein DisA with diadenylate cyclase activity